MLTTGAAVSAPFQVTDSAIYIECNGYANRLGLIGLGRPNDLIIRELLRSLCRGKMSMHRPATN